MQQPTPPKSQANPPDKLDLAEEEKLLLDELELLEMLELQESEEVDEQALIEELQELALLDELGKLDEREGPYLEPAPDDLEPEIEIFEQMCDDHRVRRELLWLTHMAEGDYKNASDIEALIPGVRTGLRRSAARAWRVVQREPKARARGLRAVYDLLFRERYRHHVSHFAAVPCRCIDCARTNFLGRSSNCSAPN